MKVFKTCNCKLSLLFKKLENEPEEINEIHVQHYINRLKRQQEIHTEEITECVYKMQASLHVGGLVRGFLIGLTTMS